ncbi:hypothetical protein ERO13_D07G066400v2 [Gossypium hirsutum]|uniref:Homologous recombination OB-fold protein OB-fold domain-containing protein n=1 Tax=Gossypium hirsutum TaxID=3635 RepID=A0A1U8NYV6_GOSHI|nr:uncharacterized protein LOC107953318 [Gossypium hirsutum]KAG4137350.1 hypothetical protein ERO13_D07G066400v2 [Gossypium hirsutum]
MEADHPWETLDIDDCGLPSLLRPCNHKPLKSTPPFPLISQSLSPTSNSSLPSSPNLIPGPAGAVQAAMLRKLHYNNNSSCIGEDPVPTQEYIRRAVVDPAAAADDDFSRDPWLFALEFIRREGLVDNGGTIGTPLSWIKTEPKLGNRKVAQVVAIIKSCTANGLGDLMVTLKDPTGTIDASIHGKVLVDGRFAKDITVGTVLILQKVSVFSPMCSARYLNITLNNVVKAIPKDTEPLSELKHTSRVISTANGIGNTKETWNQQKVSSLSPDRNANIMDNLGQTGYMRRRVLNDNGNEADATLGSRCCVNGRNRSQNGSAGKEPSTSQVITNGMEKAALLAGINGLEENVVVKKQPGSQNVVGRDNHLKSKQSSGDPNLFGIANERESVTIDADKERRDVPISRGSLPQWTDEQLDELCSFD